VFEVDEADVPTRQREGWTAESATAHADRVTDERREEEYGGVAGKIAAGGAGVLRGLSLGASDLAFRALGEEDEFRNLREVNPGISTAGEIAGGIGGAFASGGSTLAATPAGLASRAGASIARAAEGAGTIAKLAKAGAGGIIEGGIQGIGAGVSEVALSADDLTLERVASAISSNALYGGGIGGVAGVAGKGVELGLRRAKGAIDDFVSRHAAGEVTDDLAAMDAKQLRAARAKEVERIDLDIKAQKADLDAAHKAELDAIETGRVTQRQEVANDLAAFRKELKQSKVWLASKDSGVEGLESVGKRTLRADQALDRLLDDPKLLAENPKAALRQLRVQEAALSDVLGKADDLRATFVADTSGTRAAALDRIPAVLERNRALQARIGELAAAPSSAKLAEITNQLDQLKSGAPRTSTRLDQIDAARDGLGASKAGGMVQQMVGGSAYGVGAGLAGMVPFVGPALAPFAGAAASKIATGGFGKALGAASVAAAKRTSKAVGALLNAAEKVAPAAPIVASRTLASVRYAQSTNERKKQRAKDQPRKRPPLAESFKARANEVRSHMMTGPDGAPVMRPDARVALGKQFDGIRSAYPQIADMLETLAARRLEFLASKLPRRPDLDTMGMGPDIWQPSDMEMRTWARYALAAEDPGGVEERLANGQITPEDAEAYRAVYPERYADFVRQTIEQRAELQATLPFAKRLALSIFSGVPVDPSMNPEILAVLQGSFDEEPGSEGGTQAPVAAPQFGSVRNQEATASQRREGLTA
jgi:hypothetical protein